MPKKNPAVERQLESCLTVRDLIEQLQGCDPDLPVVFAYPAGDHWRNTLGGTVENVEEKQAIWSEYHRTFKIPKDGSTEEDAIEVVVLE